MTTTVSDMTCKQCGAVWPPGPEPMRACDCGCRDWCLTINEVIPAFLESIGMKAKENGKVAYAMKGGDSVSGLAIDSSRSRFTARLNSGLSGP